MSDLTVADILERAADLIEPEGAWTQGSYARGRSGRDVTTNHSAVCWCALGAIKAVRREPPFEMDDNPAARTLKDIVGGPVHDWNDAPERTQAEVVAKLREAASKAREAHQ